MSDISQAAARIVETPGTCGGRPRLDGHRLDMAWYAGNRREFGDKTAEYIKENWPYLRDDQIQALSDYYDAHPEWHEEREDEQEQ